MDRFPLASNRGGLNLARVHLSQLQSGSIASSSETVTNMRALHDIVAAQNVG